MDKLNYKEMTDEQLINTIKGIMELAKIADSSLRDELLKTRKECIRAYQSRYIGEKFMQYLS